MNVVKLLEYLGDIVDTSSKVPLSNKVMVNKKEILDVITQIMSEMPEELKKSQWILSEKDKILNDAVKEANEIKKQEIETIKMQIDKHSITLEAEKRARKLLEDAENEAKQIKLSALHYVDELLCHLDSQLDDRQEQFNEKVQREAQSLSINVQNDFNSIREIIKNNISEIREVK